MYYWENLGVAWTQIKSSKLRSILTTLGITIGIATVIFIVAILEGYTLSITKELNMLGANVFQSKNMIVILVYRSDIVSGRDARI